MSNGEHCPEENRCEPFARFRNAELATLSDSNLQPPDKDKKPCVFYGATTMNHVETPLCANDSNKN